MASQLQTAAQINNINNQCWPSGLNCSGLSSLSIISGPSGHTVWHGQHLCSRCGRSKPILWSFKVSATVVSTFAWNSKRKIHEYTSVAAKVRDMISTKSYCKDFESTNTVGISQYLTEMNNSDAQLSHKSISGLCPVREISRPWKRSRSHLALTSLLLRPQELPVSNLWRVNKFNRTME